MMCCAILSAYTVAHNFSQSYVSVTFLLSRSQVYSTLPQWLAFTNWMQQKWSFVSLGLSFCFWLPWNAVVMLFGSPRYLARERSCGKSRRRDHTREGQKEKESEEPSDWQYQYPRRVREDFWDLSVWLITSWMQLHEWSQVTYVEYKNCPANLSIMKNATLLFYAIKLGGSLWCSNRKLINVLPHLKVPASAHLIHTIQWAGNVTVLMLWMRKLKYTRSSGFPNVPLPSGRTGVQSMILWSRPAFHVSRARLGKWGSSQWDPTSSLRMPRNVILWGVTSSSVQLKLKIHR